MPAAKQMVGHQPQAGCDHEAVSYPQGVGKAPAIPANILQRSNNTYPKTQIDRLDPNRGSAEGRKSLME